MESFLLRVFCFNLQKEEVLDLELAELAVEEMNMEAKRLWKPNSKE